MARKTSSPTIADVARESGVSISTVSRILNESPLVADETLGKVRGEIQRLGYLPHSAARNLARRRTNTLGVLIESVGSSFFASVVAGAEEAAYADGFSLLIATPGHLIRGERPALGPSNTDGMLIVGVQLKKKQFSFYQEGYPIISLYQPAPRSLQIPLVSVENKNGAYKVVEHLIREHGMTRIAFLRGPKGNYDSYWREAGFRQAMKKYGLAVDEDLLGDGGFAYPNARGTVLRWVADGCLPQAIFAGNDDAALDVIMTLYGAGVRVPNDVAVVGFDDSLMAANMVPPLTTVRAPGIDVGREAARQLLQMIHTGDSTPLTLLPTELVVRSSCGCMPVSTCDSWTDLPKTAHAETTGISLKPANERR
jgi:DNA-binding LacI/PurR family transcriptional regulator